MGWLRHLWEFVKPNPGFYIANLMWIEGYTEAEIDFELERLYGSN